MGGGPKAAWLSIWRLLVYGAIAVGLSPFAWAQSGGENVKPSISFEPPDGPFGAQRLQDLRDAIAQADAETLFAVRIVFSSPQSVAELHENALRLEIPRVLARVRYGASKRSTLFLELGEYSAGETAQFYWRCRAEITLGYGPVDELASVPIDDWPVSEVHVHATAHAIRELTGTAGIVRGQIVEGSAVADRGLAGLQSYLSQQLNTKIPVSRNVRIPNRCASIVTDRDSPILVSANQGGPEGITRREGEDFRRYAFRQLAALPADSAVSIQFKLGPPTTIELLGALVEQYGIEGMYAEMIPGNGNDRVIMLAELSIHGEPMALQLRRFACRLQAGRLEVDEWYANWVQVSLPLSQAWTFLSYQQLTTASITGVFPLQDLQSLVAYYDQLARKAYPARGVKITDDCERFFD